MKNVRVVDVGRQRFAETWALQLRLHDAIARGEEPDTWLVVEHEPVVTLGRNAKREHLLLSPEALAARGVDCFEIERGGDVTYHGPGQIVVYPIAKLERFREVVPLVTAMESAAISTCAHFGLPAERWSAHRGVYVRRKQICAIGLAVKRMTSFHGLAFNVSTDLDYDRLITPCGIRERGVTSLERELGQPVSFQAAKDALLESLASAFDVTLSEASVPVTLSGVSAPHVILSGAPEGREVEGQTELRRPVGASTPALRASAQRDNAGAALAS